MWPTGRVVPNTSVMILGLCVCLCFGNISCCCSCPPYRPWPQSVRACWLLCLGHGGKQSLHTREALLRHLLLLGNSWKLNEHPHAFPGSQEMNQVPKPWQQTHLSLTWAAHSEESAITVGMHRGSHWDPAWLHLKLLLGFLHCLKVLLPCGRHLEFLFHAFMVHIVSRCSAGKIKLCTMYHAEVDLPE